MGGGIAAFEDDPVSVWCNPAGLATQQSGGAVETQTFAAYHRNSPATLAVNDPAAVPTYVGAFFQLGTVERPQGIGLCYVTPMILRMVFDTPDVTPSTTLKTDQRFSR